MAHKANIVLTLIGIGGNVGYNSILDNVENNFYLSSFHMLQLKNISPATGILHAYWI